MRAHFITEPIMFNPKDPDERTFFYLTSITVLCLLVISNVINQLL